MTELQIKNHLDQGRSIRQISSIENIGYSTARYYVKKFGMKSSHKSFLEQKTPDVCSNCSAPLSSDNTYSGVHHKKCKKCFNKYRTARFVEVKKRMIEHMGGKCAVCGYNKYYGALECHHKDPSKKDFTIARTNMGWEKMLKEMEKCILVCANCHREIHGGLL